MLRMVVEGLDDKLFALTKQYHHRSSIDDTLRGANRTMPSSSSSSRESGLNSTIGVTNWLETITMISSPTSGDAIHTVTSNDNEYYLGAIGAPNSTLFTESHENIHARDLKLPVQVYSALVQHAEHDADEIVRYHCELGIASFEEALRRQLTSTVHPAIPTILKVETKRKIPLIQEI